MTEVPSPPTRYLIQEKHLSLDNRFTVSDEAGTVHYKVNSTLFAMGDKLVIMDVEGNELIKIRQDNLHFRLTYRVYSIRSGTIDRQIASIRRTGSLWQHKLEISSLNGQYVMQKQGGVSSTEFTLTKDGNIIATVTKDVSPTTSLYWVDVAKNIEENHSFIVAMVVVLASAQRLRGNPMAKPRLSRSVSAE